MEAKKSLNVALQSDQTNPKLYAALMHQSSGECDIALGFASEILSFEPFNQTALSIYAFCSLLELKLNDSLVASDTLFALNMSRSIVNREILAFNLVHIDTLWSSFSSILTKVFNSSIIAAWVDSESDIVVQPYWFNILDRVSLLSDSSRQCDNMMLCNALKATSRLGHVVLLDSPGFILNKRYERMFGLSVLEMTQKLKKHVNLIKNGYSGLSVLDDGSTCEIGSVNGRIFSVDDLFDIAIKWRYFFDIKTPVLRVKGVPIDALKTMIVAKGRNITKYAPYYDAILMRIKNAVLSEIIKDTELSSKDIEKLELLSETTTVDEFLRSNNSSRLVHQGYCLGTSNETLKLDGFVAFLENHNEGINFGVYASNDVFRAELFEKELDHIFQNIVNSLVLGTDSNEVLDYALTLFYYWVNFVPLARGTSSTGYAVFASILLAVGEELVSGIPRGKQLDWEAILISDPRLFILNVRSWFSARIPTTISYKWLQGEDDFDLDKIFRTPRDVLTALSKRRCSQEF